MSATIESISACRKKLRIEVDANKVAGVRAEILQDFRKQANIPGFRAGKAPEPIVERHYAKQINDEVRQRLIPDSYREALNEQKLRVVSMPQIDQVEFEPGKPLKFTAAVDTAPEFKLPDYKGIAVKKTEQLVTDEEITKTIDGLRDQQAEFTDVTGRGVGKGDYAVVNYTGTSDGKPLSEIEPDAKSLAEHKDFWLLVESDSFLPGFCDQLMGAQVGEKKQVTVDFPADFAVKSVAGKKAAYTVDITGIKEKKLPEVNEDFAKRVGAESVEKLKSEIRKGLEAERESQSTSDVRKQIIDHLTGQVEFELPESLVQQETRSIIYDLVRENSTRGVTKEALEEKKEEISKFAAQSAKERLKTSFILDNIAREEKITVSEAEMEERIQSMSARYRMTPEKLKAQLDEHGNLGEVEEQILVGKTLDFLIASAKVETTKA